MPQNHRPSDAQCGTVPPPGQCFSSGSSGGCTKDSDCTAGVNGRCSNEGPVPSCSCTYDACQHDNDCTGDTCACHGSAYVLGGNVCVPGNCHVDANCGPGGYCSPAEDVNSCGSLGGYYCHTPGDLCIDDSDCPASPGGPQVCTFVETTNRWECQSTGVCAGTGI